MIEPLTPVLIALVDGVHPDIARLAVGLRLASLTDGSGAGSGFFKLATRPLISTGMSQVVQVRYGDTGQALIGRKIKQPPGTLAKLFGGLP